MKKIILCILIALCTLCTATAGISAFANDPSCTHTYSDNGICTSCGGYEPAEEYVEANFLIHNAGQLMDYAQRVNSGQAVNTGYLKSDIDMSGITDFVPIGTWNGDDSTVANNLFKGYFDGNGYKIKNLTVVDNGEYAAVGLFGGVSGTIEDLTVENFTFVQTDERNLYVGAVAGYMTDRHSNPKVLNVSVNGADITAKTMVGGLVGYIDTGNVQNSSALNLKINTTASVGGLVGLLDYSTISQSFVNGATITSTSSVGGFAGQVNYGAVSQCYSTGLTLSGAEGHVGGFAGEDIQSYRPTSFYRCVTTYNKKGPDNLATQLTNVGCDDRAFTSGSATFYLGAPYGQNIDNGEATEPYPVIGGAPVYYDFTNAKFTNFECVHEYGSDDICTLCNTGREPSLVGGVYQIETLSNYYWFIESIRSGLISNDSKAILINDVGTESEPITRMLGESIIPFVGVLDGNNKTVTVNLTGISGVGLVSVAGNRYNQTVIKNLTVKGVIHNYVTTGAGGIIGRILKGSDVKILNCVNEATVTAQERAGGIVGWSDAISLDIYNCVNKGRIEAETKVGGILGAQEEVGFWADLNRCANLGEVAATKTELGYAGGVIGYWGAPNSQGVKNCYNLGSVSGSYSGLLVGYASVHFDIEKCFGAGTVTGAVDNKYLVGGDVNPRNVKNVYLIDTVGEDAIGTTVSEKSFKDGTIALLLNGNVVDGTQDWYQNIGVDDFPSFSGATVYQNYDGSGANAKTLEITSNLEPFERMTALEEKTLTFGVARLDSVTDPITYEWYKDGQKTNVTGETFDLSSLFVGERTVYAVAICNGYKLKSAEITFIVEGLPLAEDFFVFTPPSDLVFSNTAKVPTVDVKDDVVGVGAISAIRYINTADLDRLLTSAVDEGEYIVAIIVSDGKYYLGDDLFTVGRFTITPCEHIYAIEGDIINYSADGEGHWQKCTHCGYDDLQTKLGHSGSDDGDCATAVLCEVCTYVYVEGKVHELVMKNDKDEDFHVLECVRDGCDHEEDEYHIFDETVRDEKFLRQEADCDEGKTYYHSCLCGRISDEYYFEVGFYLGHKLVLDSENTDETGHLLKCSVEGCDYEKEAEHAFNKRVEDEKFVKTNADCLTHGEYYYSCECGYKGEETFLTNTLDHDFEGGEWTGDDEEHWKKCSRCDEEDLQNAIPHSFDGVCDKDCNCGATREVEHDFSSLVVTDSEHSYVCSRCGEEKEGASHHGGEPTCLAKGVCADCGAEYGELSRSRFRRG